MVLFGVQILYYSPSAGHMHCMPSSTAHVHKQILTRDFTSCSIKQGEIVFSPNLLIFLLTVIGKAVSLHAHIHSLTNSTFDFN